MVDPLQSIRCLTPSSCEAIRWACLLEATAPKAGNVYPGRSFDNLSYLEFVTAADIAAERLGHSQSPISERMLDAVRETVSRTETNVNLGIVLLLGPLVAADEAMIAKDITGRRDAVWLEAIDGVLKGLDAGDGGRIYQSIAAAKAGGLGNVESMDVFRVSGEVNIRQAMKMAQGYDRIARQYAGGFTDLLQCVVPTLKQSIAQRGDVLSGISHAHVQLLRQEPDSLIARKNGAEVANTVQQRARQVDLESSVSLASFDTWLRHSGHQLNPGTTADLIAAALFVLLRTDPSEQMP